MFWRPTGSAAAGDDPERAAKKFIRAIRRLNRTMGIPETLPEIRKKDIPALAKLADAEANPLYPVPVLWNAAELQRFYYAVMERKKHNWHRKAAG